VEWNGIISSLCWDNTKEGVATLIIKYICECCDKLVEEMVVSEDLLIFLDDEDSRATLTGLGSEDIINLEQQGSLVLKSMCPECLAEISLDKGGNLSFGAPIIN
jgi:hypothetical protein